MREIKFRGKSKKDGKWIYGDLLRNVDGDFAVVQPFGIHMNNYCDPYEVNPDTIGQYTGLKDNQTKMREVYEHDLYEVNGVLCEVVYNSDIASFVFLEVPTQELGITPIGEMFKIFTCVHKGNIFDNMELL